MLVKRQKQDLLNILSQKGISVGVFEQLVEHTEFFKIRLKESVFYFSIMPKSKSLVLAYDIKSSPRTEMPDMIGFNWQGVLRNFEQWADIMQSELNVPDPWAEAAKTAQLFAPTATPSDDKFTRAELAEVQGQLRALGQSFATAALPEAARQQLIELTQTAAVKAEGLTKKDWQNWIIGGFISAITALLLNPTQAAEVLKLVKAAFGGLFLH